MTLHAERAAEAATGFVWFSDRVKAAAAKGGIEALDALRELIDGAVDDKLAGYGPPQDEINKARRKWLDLYSELYRRPA